MNYPPAIQKLIDQFAKLPTVGPKTAERYVFYLLKQPKEIINNFAKNLSVLTDKITICKNCYAYTQTSPCPICSSDKRNKNLLCVVADYRNMITIESTGQYNGYYHVLGGHLNAIKGIKPENLNINTLIKKAKNEKYKEIILALSPNMEGETTALYLVKILKPYKLKITRLAKGLPVGADLEYADEITLTNALKYRNEL
ncbi:recombination protein RecR [Candidatus Falkowbacteria bacterium CG_4_9_14_3_um_filter_36_9]|uniref:Recombination protein RecR n=1 Tax=Candidatus Falkowbacteria bacterium CG02_land_8_20_14_3_00_36_14 TaxID=1974560 RepID=A0A2M7DKA0_9BACT|nr:MAG: recombination protein RecR [Candidatus Falkowbacteria bacterium CG02_land_8_20_14_3_00_36_14]PIX12029.1 MAG: recombination protein RecR [Candidatus Falkowbacteria bacterium CG_4_8_14_3_um_filter_36_11]PJA11152.1 MAG: recombination protein RecR [Candidatus Falkowbacteria bacterium CG_4_10_14_0_2_um_filter_36_22]PJB18112.1 MAG: recombination protein RecR [Candidatus Falkowbacteria bacterium CG_4_9_14_3_um_filter_36_9]